MTVSRLLSLIGGTLLPLVVIGQPLAQQTLTTTTTPIGIVPRSVEIGTITVNVAQVSSLERLKAEQNVLRMPVTRVGPQDLGKTIPVLPGGYVEVAFAAEA